ncbi:MAG: CBS domain-containing protein [Coriobacteriia bacterium]|nr:CBS domain-containing protein [Coriobacteriia bacterium]
MIYLSQLLDRPIIDSEGIEVGRVSDLAVSAGDVFPRVTAIAALQDSGDTILIPWQSSVADVTVEAMTLSMAADGIEPGFLQDDEIFLVRDVLDKQIVDVMGKKVVTVNDLQLSDAVGILRLTAAEVSTGARLRRRSPGAEKLLGGLLHLFGGEFKTSLIAWNYIDLPGRDLSSMRLSVSHKRLHELHPADVADIIEQLAPEARAAVFAHLDAAHAAETISELEDEFQADVIDELNESHASNLLAEMGPDDAADIIGDLERDKAERLLRLMGYEDSEAIRRLLGYGEESAGGIMTNDVAVINQTATVGEATEYLHSIAEKYEDLHYLYLTNDHDELVGAVGLLDLLVAPPDKPVSELTTPEDKFFKVAPDEDQEDVAKLLARYNLLAVPVVDDDNHLLGMVTIDDAIDVMVEEAQEDLEFATGLPERSDSAAPPTLWHRIVDTLRWILPRHVVWVLIWLVALAGTQIFGFYISGFYNQLYTAAMSGQGVPSWAWIVQMAYNLTSLLTLAVTFLPVSLLTIQHGYLRAAELLIDSDAEERPRKVKRFLYAAAVAVGSAVLITLVLTLYIWIISGFAALQWLLIAYFGIAELVAMLIAALIIMARINRTVTRDDHDLDIAPLRSANWMMLIFTVLLIVWVLAVPLIHQAVLILLAK